MLDKVLKEHIIRAEGLTLLQDLALKGSLAGPFQDKVKQVFSDETIKKEDKTVSLKCYRWYNTFDKKEKPHTNIFNDLYMSTLVRDSDRTATTALRNFLLKNNLIEKNVFYETPSLAYHQPFVRDTYAHFIVEFNQKNAPILLGELDENGISFETENSIKRTPKKLYDILHERDAAIVAQVIMRRGGPHSLTDLMLAQGKYRTELHNFFDIMELRNMKFDDEELPKESVNSTQDVSQEKPKVILPAQNSSFARRVFSSICNFVHSNGN